MTTAVKFYLFFLHINRTVCFRDVKI